MKLRSLRHFGFVCIFAAQAMAQQSRIGKSNVFYAGDVEYSCSAPEIALAINALPSTGGSIDARDCRGTMTWNMNPFATIRNPYTLLLGDVVIVVSPGVTIDLTMGNANNARIEGAGPHRTVFNFSNTGTEDGFKIGATNLFLGGLTINMQSTGTGHGVEIVALITSRLWDLEVENAGGNGIYFNPGGNSIQRNDFYNIQTHNNAGHGWFENATQYQKSSAAQTIIHLESNNNGGDGIRSAGFNIDTPNNRNVYINPRTTGNAGSGLNFISDGDIQVIGLETEYNGDWGLNVDSHSTDITVTGADLGSGNGKGTINILGTRIQVTGNSNGQVVQPQTAFTGIVSQYNGIATVSSGVPSLIACNHPPACVETNQTAAIGQTILYAVPSNGAGMYRLTWDIVTTATDPSPAAAVSLLIHWNNGAASQTFPTNPVSLHTLGAELDSRNSTAPAGSINFYSTAEESITYQTTLANVTGAPRYTLRIRLEYLGN